MHLPTSKTLLAVIVISVAFSGSASAHVAPGTFSHGLETNADHSAGGGSYNCGSLVVRLTSDNRSFDNKSHRVYLWMKNCYTGATYSGSAGFTQNKLYWLGPGPFSRLNAATSHVEPIHTNYDLIYPRFQHSMWPYCE